jgi:hypothetical protein
MLSASKTVDLHIEKIAKGYRAFSPADALIYQKDYFEMILKMYRNSKGMKIDFIHGSGEGVLRADLLMILREKYPSFYVEDAPFSRYGFMGAIRVTIK